MTASSPWIEGMIETRKSIVRPAHAQAEAAVLRHALLGDVELRHDLEPADDRVVVPLVERLDGGVEHAVDAVLGEHLAVLGLDVDVGGAALDRAEDQRVDEAHDRALGRQRPRSASSASSSASSCRRRPSLACSRQDLAAAVAPQQRGHALGRRDRGLDRPLEQELELVDALRVLERRRRRARCRSPSRRTGTQRVAHQQLERHLAPQRRGRRGGRRRAARTAAPGARRAAARRRASSFRRRHRRRC